MGHRSGSRSYCGSLFETFETTRKRVLKPSTRTLGGKIFENFFRSRTCRLSSSTRTRIESKRRSKNIACLADTHTRYDRKKRLHDILKTIVSDGLIRCNDRKFLNKTHHRRDVISSMNLLVLAPLNPHRMLCNTTHQMGFETGSMP